MSPWAAVASFLLIMTALFLSCKYAYWGRQKRTMFALLTKLHGQTVTVSHCWSSVTQCTHTGTCSERERGSMYSTVYSVSIKWAPEGGDVCSLSFDTSSPQRFTWKSSMESLLEQETSSDFDQDLVTIKTYVNKLFSRSQTLSCFLFWSWRWFELCREHHKLLVVANQWNVHTHLIFKDEVSVSFVIVSQWWLCSSNRQSVSLCRVCV